MKHLYLSSLLLLILSTEIGAQCTPVDCSASLPPYGGICDEEYADGEVNQLYSDFESFVLTANCFDAGEIDPGNAGTEIYIVEVDNFSFSGLPAGITLSTDQTSYASMTSGPTLGCIAADGTPTEAGLFEATANFDAEVEAFIFGGCPTGFGVATSASSSYAINFTVLPDASFSGLNGPYCEVDGDVTLTPTGTVGGTFTGPGVSGNIFSPENAGPGTHTIEYEVTAQEGSAVSPATNSSTMTVIVDQADEYFADNDGDGYGDASDIALSCTGAPNGYTTDDTDCNDFDDQVNPGATEVCNGIDDNCDGDMDEGFDIDGDGVTTCGGDCDDADGNVNPNATEICNGIDDNCDGNTDEGFDVDGDGVSSCGGDCDDNDPNAYPGATEVCGDSDLNCDGILLEDTTVFIIESICIGDTLVIGGNPLTNEGNYILNFVGGNGCDSIVNLDLQFIGEEPFFIPLPSDLFCLEDPTVDLSGNVQPSGGTFSGNGITGNTFDPSLAGVGLHTISYTVTDSLCTYSASYEVTVDMCTSTEDEDGFTNKLIVFPNPVSSSLNVELEFVDWQAVNYQLLNTEGRVIKSEGIAANTQLLKIDMSNIPIGIYFLSVRSAEKSIMKKIHVIR